MEIMNSKQHTTGNVSYKKSVYATLPSAACNQDPPYYTASQSPYNKAESPAIQGVVSYINCTQ